MKTTLRVAILLAILATIVVAGRASGDSSPLRTATKDHHYICPIAHNGAELPATRANILAGVCVVSDVQTRYWHRLARKRYRLLRAREHRIVELVTTVHKLRARRAAGGQRLTGGRATSGWVSGYATWYGPGFYGHSPACGGPGLTESSWWVATVPAHCGANVTVCATRCVTAPARDTGAFPSSNLDLTPAVARALGGLYTRPVRWRIG